jgi:hypothetical protein
MSPAAMALAVLLLAQATPGDDGPIGTAQRTPAATTPESPAPDHTPRDPIGGVLLNSPPEAPEAAPPSLAFDPHTQTDGETLQVILGQQATFRLDDHGQPVLDAVADGRLADAHPEGTVAETFTAPKHGLLAAALDGSAEKRVSVLKVWNGLDHPVELRVIGLVLRSDVLTPVPLAICPIPPGGVGAQSWPAPIVAVGLARFKTATKAALAAPACHRE